MFWSYFISQLNDVCSLLVFSVMLCYCLQTLLPKQKAFGWRHYHTTLSTREKTGCVCVGGGGLWMCVYEVSNCEQDSVHVHSCMHPCVIYNCVRKLPMGTDSRGWEGFVWPTKDICGMSFLGEGLQLVVTPAVLSVAVPGMLHHLKKKITIQLIRRCEVSWLGLRSSNKHKERRRRKSMMKQKKKKHFCLIKQLYLSRAM